MNEYVIVQLYNLSMGTVIDIEIPLFISADELICSLKAAYPLQMAKVDFLSSENPIAFLKGKKLLEDFGIRMGSTLIIQNV